MKLTTCQLNAEQNILKWIRKTNKRNQDLLYTLSGFAGTGKTTLINNILKRIRISVVVSAPTHKAKDIIAKAVNKKGETIQSLLGLRPHIELKNFDPNKPVFNKKAQQKIKNYKLVVIDEGSQVNASSFDLIFKIARDYNIMILYVGDDYQLPPINEIVSKVFNIKNISYLTTLVRQSSTNPNIILLELIRKDIRNIIINNYISLLKKEKYKNVKTIKYFINFIKVKIKDNKKIKEVVETIIKQIDYSNLKNLKSLITILSSEKDFLIFNSFLSYIKHIKFNIIDKEGFKVLNKVDFFKESLNYYYDSEYKYNFNFIKTLCYTNNKVEVINKYIRNKINKSKELLAENDILLGYKTVSKSINDNSYQTIIKNSKDYIVEHVDIVDRIIRGIDLKGYEVKFKDIKRSVFVLHRDSYNDFKIEYLKRLYRAKNFKMWKPYYDFKNSIILFEDLTDNKGNIIIGKDISYGYSMTCHKAQGSTYVNTSIVLKELKYNKDPLEQLKLIYVALSRSTGINIIYDG